jgi:hypothetical protein
MTQLQTDTVSCSGKYSNYSVHEQSVYEFSLLRDAQINTRFSIYEQIFAYTSSFLSQTDRCSRRLFSGGNWKLIFVLRVLTLRSVLEERIKLVNRGITVIASKCETNKIFWRERFSNCGWQIGSLFQHAACRESLFENRTRLHRGNVRVAFRVFVYQGWRLLIASPEYQIKHHCLWNLLADGSTLLLHIW